MLPCSHPQLPDPSANHSHHTTSASPNGLHVEESIRAAGILLCQFLVGRRGGVVIECVLLAYRWGPLFCPPWTALGLGMVCKSWWGVSPEWPRCVCL